MTDASPDALRAEALTADCRYYAQALSQVAGAIEAAALRDQRLTGLHMRRAHVAYLRAAETEADRVKRTLRDMAVRGERCEVSTQAALWGARNAYGIGQ